MLATQLRLLTRPFSIFVMPKVPSSKSGASSSRLQGTKDAASNSKQVKDPKASHLYTDDNPSTTLKGTGFKDRDMAKKTISLVSKRSLTYQFQTINTMYYRASHHPHKNAAIEAAMAIFKEWLDMTYPETKAGLRANDGFKPVLSKEIVSKYIERIRAELSEEEVHVAELYVNLKKGKRLANVLMDDKNPAGPDLDRARYDALDELVPEGQETSKGWQSGDLWQQNKTPTLLHLKMIAWAWSPVPARSL